MENELKDKTNIDPRSAHQMIAEYEGYANTFPKDTLNVTDCFIKASRVAIAIGDSKKAVGLLEKEMAAYPKASRTEQALFLLAFTFENHVKDLAKAEAAYKNFIAEYPKSDLADDARTALLVLGKSPDELVKSFAKPQ